MDLEKLILESYQTAVALNTKASSELKSSLKTSERVPRFIAKLKEEFARLPPHLVSRETIVSLTTDLTNLFLFQIEQAAKQKHMSEAEKNKFHRDQERKDIINKAADTGVITDEVIDALKETD